MTLACDPAASLKESGRCQLKNHMSSKYRGVGGVVLGRSSLNFAFLQLIYDAAQTGFHIAIFL